MMLFRIREAALHRLLSPGISDIDLDFLNQAAFRRDTEEIAQQHHFNQADRVDGGPAVIRAVEVGHGIADKFKVDSCVDFADQMVFGDEFVEGDGFKLVLLRGRFSEYGGQSVFCTDLIRSKSRLFSQDFVSSLKRGLIAPVTYLIAFHNVSPICAGFRVQVIPALSKARNLSSALPLLPEIMAPAWPIRFPFGAVTPAI